MTTPVGSTFTPAAERILLEALDLFARTGFDGASVRQIADSAQVSPALVMHHYGSKEGLRAACDEYALAQAEVAIDGFVHHADSATPAAGWFDSLAFLDEPMPTVMAYMAKVVVDGGPAGDALVDALVGAVVQYQEQAIASGHMTPTDDPVMRAVLLTAWDIAPFLLARHVARLTGSDPRTPDGMQRQAREAFAIYGSRLLTNQGDTTDD